MKKLIFACSKARPLKAESTSHFIEIRKARQLYGGNAKKSKKLAETFLIIKMCKASIKQWDISIVLGFVWSTASSVRWLANLELRQNIADRRFCDIDGRRSRSMSTSGKNIVCLRSIICSIQKTLTIPTDKLLWIRPYYYTTFVDWTYYVERTVNKSQGSHARQELLENGSEPRQTELRLIYERFPKKAKNQQCSYSSASQTEAQCSPLELVTLDRLLSRVYKKIETIKSLQEMWP